MFAQYVLTIAILVVLLYILWRVCGKRLLEDYYPSLFVEVDLEVVKKRLEELECRKRELEGMKKVVAATEELVDVETELKKLRKIRNRVEEKLE